MTQVTLALLVLSTLGAIAATFEYEVVTTSDGGCWLEISSVFSRCCSTETLPSFGALQPDTLWTAEPCVNPEVDDECDFSVRPELSFQAHVDRCHKKSGNAICVDGSTWTYNCEDPKPANPTEEPIIPYPSVPGTDLGTPCVHTPVPDPAHACFAQVGFGVPPLIVLCDDMCNGLTCEDALIAAATVDDYEGSSDGGDTGITCHAAYEALSVSCPQCACVSSDEIFVDADIARLFSDGPLGGWLRGRGASVAAAAAALGGIAAAVALVGAAVLRRRRGVMARAGEPLTAGAEASDAVDSEQ